MLMEQPKEIGTLAGNAFPPWCSVTAIFQFESVIRDMAMTRLRRPTNRRELGPPALRWRTVPLRVIATTCIKEGRAVTAKSSPSADSAEEICQWLEQAVLKYFPRPIENVDTFLFAHDDDSAVASQSEGRPKPPTQAALFEASSGA